MDTLTSGSSKSLTFDLGAAEFNITAVSYRVNDENGVELVPSTPVPGWTTGSLEAVFSIDGTVNTLPDGSHRGAREVIVRFTDGTTSLESRQSYVLVLGAILRIPETSFVTLTMAEMLAEEVVGLGGWANADEMTRIKSLLAARDKIASLLLRDVGRMATDSAGYDSDYAGYGLTSGSTFRLDDLSLSEWDATSPQLKRAVRLAQLAQADWFADPQSGQSDNVRSIVIGESSRTFFQGVKTPLAPKSMRYLGRFLAPGRIVRG